MLGCIPIPSMIGTKFSVFVGIFMADPCFKFDWVCSRDSKV